MCVQIDLMKCSKLLLACNIQLKVFFVHNSHLENTDLHLNQECVRVQVLDMEVHLSKIRSEKKIECFDIIGRITQRTASVNKCRSNRCLSHFICFLRCCSVCAGMSATLHRMAQNAVTKISVDEQLKSIQLW